MRVHTCLVFITLAAVAAAEIAIMDDLVSKVTDSVASAATNATNAVTNAATNATADAAGDAVQHAANITGNAAHHAANSTGTYVDSTLNSTGSKLDKEGGAAPASGHSAASSMHPSSVVIMTTLAVAGLALNFV